MIEIPRPALFLAGKAFVRYRRQGGEKQNVLADFFIGAHAAVTRYPILTRDTRRYSTYLSLLSFSPEERRKDGPQPTKQAFWNDRIRAWRESGPPQGEYRVRRGKSLETRQSLGGRKQRPQWRAAHHRV